MPGCLVQVCEAAVNRAEHLSVTSAGSTREGVTVMSARPCQSWGGVQVNRWKVFLSPFECHMRDWGCQCDYFRLPSEEHSSPLPCDVWAGSRNCPSVREIWQMPPREENQPAQATLWDIICQGQFVFAVRWWYIVYHRKLGGLLVSSSDKQQGGGCIWSWLDVIMGNKAFLQHYTQTAEQQPHIGCGRRS